MLRGKGKEGMFGSDPVSIDINTSSSKQGINAGPQQRTTKKIKHGMLDIKSTNGQSQAPLSQLDEHDSQRTKSK